MIKTYKNRPKDMTYILGSKCSDGVVLIGDRKIVLDDGATHEFEDKIFMYTRSPWLVVGSSGTTGLFEKFRDRLGEYLTTPAYDGNINTLTTEIEAITSDLNATYQERLPGQIFDVLLGIKSTRGVILKYIYPQGFAEGVRNYKAIGHGEPYGSFFLKQWWRKDMTMLEVAELGFFIIKYIEEFELDNTVGIGKDYPQVWLIPNKQPLPKATPAQISVTAPHTLSSDEMATIQDKVLERFSRFKDIIQLG